MTHRVDIAPVLPPAAFRVGVKVRVFNAALDAAIRAKGWQRTEAALELGISLNTLYQYLRFRTYPVDDEQRLKFACVLGVPDDVLFPEEISGVRLLKQPEPLTFTRQEAIEAGLVADGQLQLDEIVNRVSARETIQEALETLRPREVKVLTDRFGLNGKAPMTLGAAGAGIGVSRERTRQIEAKALRKMRHPSRSVKLRTLLEGSNA